jgi:hypothetical protein
VHTDVCAGGKLIVEDADLAQLAALATTPSLMNGAATSLNAFPEWANPDATFQPGLDSSLGQVFDFDLDTIRQFNSSLEGMGIDPEMMGWEHTLHQPPW